MAKEQLEDDLSFIVIAHSSLWGCEIPWGTEGEVGRVPVLPSLEPWEPILILWKYSLIPSYLR